MSEISTESEAENEGRSFLAGANFYIVKPREPQPLVENLCMLPGIDAAQAAQTGKG